MLSGKTEDEFIGQYRRTISLPIVPQGEKGFFQLCLTEKVKAVMSGWPVGYIKQRKLFQFIDKPFLRAFGSLGNGSKTAYVRAVQGNNPVRFAKINIFQDNASGTAGLVRQASYSDAVPCSTVSLSIFSSPSFVVAWIGSITAGVAGVAGVTTSSGVFPFGSILTSDSGSGVVD